MKRLMLTAVLTGVALIIFVVEAQFPPLTPIPGIKLGFANVVTLFAAFLGLNEKETFLIMTARVFAAAFVLAQPALLLYSFTGGAVSVTVTFLLKKQGEIITGIFAAAAHNITQLSVACITFGSPAVLFYAPALLMGGVLSGAATGITVWRLFKYHGNFAAYLRKMLIQNH